MTCVLASGLGYFCGGNPDRQAGSPGIGTPKKSLRFFDGFEWGHWGCGGVHVCLGGGGGQRWIGLVL